MNTRHLQVFDRARGVAGTACTQPGQVAQGVPVDRAVLGTLLFRFVYYVVPFLTTLPVYASFLSRRDVEADVQG